MFLLAALTPALLSAQSTAAHDSAARATRAPTAHADSDSVDEIAERPPRVAFGVTGRASNYVDGHAEYGSGVLLQLAVLPGISLGVNPSYTWATNARQTSGSGSFQLSSVPITADVSHTLPGAWSPELGLSFDLGLPTGSRLDTTASGTSLGGSVGLTLAPTSSLRLSGDAWRELYGSDAGLTGRTGTTSLSGGVSADAGSRLTLNAGMSADVGTPDAGATLARSVGAGASVALAGPLTLTVDGGHRLAGDAPSWSLAVGIGTAFAGVPTVGPASPLGRLRHALGITHGRGAGSTKTTGKGHA